VGRYATISWAFSRIPSVLCCHVVVTGATDGIGLEFVRQLAKNGLNVLLVSRNAEKLSSIALDVEAANPEIKTKTFTLDFSRPTEEAWAALETMCSPLDISILVNNVGKSYDMPTPFAQTNLGEMNDIIKLNIVGTLRTTRTILPGMIQRHQKSLILNLGSISGMIPTPLLTTYAASKAFLVHFTESLEGELSGTKVDVKLLNTYYVVSAMSKIRKPSMFVPTPKSFVSSVLAHPRSGGRGTAGRNAPYWSHALLEFVVNNVVGANNKILVTYIKSMNESIRKRALKKLERETGKKSS